MDTFAFGLLPNSEVSTFLLVLASNVMASPAMKFVKMHCLTVNRELSSSVSFPSWLRVLRKPLWQSTMTCIPLGTVSVLDCENDLQQQRDHNVAMHRMYMPGITGYAWKRCRLHISKTVLGLSLIHI